MEPLDKALTIRAALPAPIGTILQPVTRCAFSPMVAVGTRIAPRPPHRSRRALLTHRAPPSGSGVEAMQRLRVQYPDRREKAVGHAGELIPGKERPLAAPFERL